jgi:hypothetical protein
MLTGVQGTRWLATLAAVLALGCVPGCRGDDEASATDYREEANRICADSKQAVEALPPPTSAAGFERYLGRLKRIGRRYDRAFEALDPPAELRGQHRRVVRLSREGDQLLDELQTALRDGRQPLGALRSNLPELERLAREGNALARRMDLPDCVTPLALPGVQPEPS